MQQRSVPAWVDEFDADLIESLMGIVDFVEWASFGVMWRVGSDGNYFGTFYDSYMRDICLELAICWDFVLLAMYLGVFLGNMIGVFDLYDTHL